MALALAEGALALAHQCLLVALHALQLLLSAHAAPLQRRVPRVQALQCTLWSLLQETRGGEGHVISPVKTKPERERD